MPKATLTFNLPEESEEHYNAIHGGDYRYRLNDFDNWVRGLVKHGNLPEPEYALYQGVRDKLREYMDGLDY